MLVIRPTQLSFGLILIAGISAAWLTFTANPRSVAAVVDEQSRTEGEEASKVVFFREKVLPLLESRCFECHGPNSKAKGDLKLSSRASILTGGESGAAIVPGKPDESLLIQAVRYEGFEMPPRSRMPDEEIAILSQWIADGAVWPEGDVPEPAEQSRAAFPMQERIASHWAWKKIERPAVPEVQQSHWPASDIDRFLLAKMEDAGIAPAPDADRRVLLRRLYFDLIGLPPSIEQQDQFMNDPAETAVAMEKVVDELLASPKFGERWGRHWLDLVRYAETLGHEFDYPLPYAWRYRDYVIRAINEDVPYNDFVREHIAGDLMREPRRNSELGFNESIIATGFWYLCEDKHAPVDVKGEEATRIDNQIDVFGKTFLGLTIACARCHDHKFDTITADDYYALSGFLQSSRRRVEWIDGHDETGKLVKQLRDARTNAVNAMADGMKQIRIDAREDLLLRVLGESDRRYDDIVTEESVSKIKQELEDPKAKELSHPLSLFACLVQKSAEKSDTGVIAGWILAREEASTRIQELSKFLMTPMELASTEPQGKARPLKSYQLADLRRGIPSGWLTFGAAFDGMTPGLRDEFHRTGDVGGDEGHNGFGAGGFQRSGEFGSGILGGGFGGGAGGFGGGQTGAAEPLFREMQWSKRGSQPDKDGYVSSMALSPKLKGQLHSPEFTLMYPEIQILASGTNARVRLVIDGYVMNEFSELLFSGCRQPIETDGEFRWIRIGGDVRRYMGHRCHLEFLDEGDGWFAVREVRLMSEPGLVPESFPDIASVNQKLLRSLINREPVDQSRRLLVREWAGLSDRDSAWAELVVKLRLMPKKEQSLLDAACDKWKKLAEQPQPGDPVLVMCEGTGEDEHVFIRGNHNNPGPVAKRHLLTALDHGKTLERPVLSGRMELADRVLDDANPFPTRVAVNRVWQHLFGRGIVASSDNFGVLGEAPTHPELLDLLADDFRKDGWSIKRLIKRLVMTRAYRLSSQRNQLAEQVDPTNKLLHRFSVRRLEGEAIRDSILSISGQLDETMYGPSVPVYLSSFMEGRGRPKASGPLDGAGRRSIYQGVNRNFLNPFMLAFDTPQPATAISRRSVSNVPAQSLILMNNEFVHQQANVWAKHLLTAGLPDDTAIINHAYRVAFARVPSETELASLLEFIRADEQSPSDSTTRLQDESTLTSICHVLLNHKELLFLE
ncbi:MAG: PSD1 and planctomycete cytochrome C domain-containing protein [Planctomycetaceae bacterium]